MATIGVDCQIVLDGTGYFLAPHTYLLRRPRLRRSAITKDGDERYVDLGPGKREWHMTVLCLNQMTDYGGRAALPAGIALRDALRASYAKTAASGTGPLLFTDLDGTGYQVHFDDLVEEVREPRTQLTDLTCHSAIVLVEA